MSIHRSLSVQGKLGRQRNDLVSANAQLIERRRFMEAVLSGVSAGVIGLDTSHATACASLTTTDSTLITRIGSPAASKADLRPALSLNVPSALNSSV